MFSYEFWGLKPLGSSPFKFPVESHKLFRAAPLMMAVEVLDKLNVLGSALSVDEVVVLLAIKRLSDIS